MNYLSDELVLAYSDVIISRRSNSGAQTLGASLVPPLWRGVSESDCRNYRLSYCRTGVRTFDGITVRFQPRSFDHAFFESPHKTEFSRSRAERVHWIRSVLQDPSAVLRQGFDKKKRQYNPQRRVAIWPPEAYVVVIEIDLRDPMRAFFITAFKLSEPSVERTFAKLLAGPPAFPKTFTPKGNHVRCISNDDVGVRETC